MLSGCAIGLGKSLHQYGLSDTVEATVKEKARPISADKSEYVFLSFTFDTEYADRAYRKLLDACPHGRIVNIQSRYSTDLGFLAYRNKLHLAATCID